MMSYATYAMALAAAAMVSCGMLVLCCAKHALGWRGGGVMVLLAGPLCIVWARGY